MNINYYRFVGFSCIPRVFNNHFNGLFCRLGEKHTPAVNESEAKSGKLFHCNNVFIYKINVIHVCSFKLLSS